VAFKRRKLQRAAWGYEVRTAFVLCHNSAWFELRTVYQIISDLILFVLFLFFLSFRETQTLQRNVGTENSSSVYMSVAQVRS
jgi:hypothetical protein